MSVRSPLISASVLRNLLQQQKSKSVKSVAVLDCSHDLKDATLGFTQYTTKHIPTSVFVSLERDMCSATAKALGPRAGGRHPLPARAEVAAYCRGVLGLNDDTHIVVYDRSQGMYAGRVWWTMKWMGHTEVSVLDGGLQAWEAAGGEVEAGAGYAATADGVQGNFSDRGPVAAYSVKSFEEVLSNALLPATSKPAFVVVDARSNDRYQGQNETVDAVGGHIPGAANRFFRLNINEAAGGCFKDPATLGAEWEAQFPGIREDPTRFVMQCGSGVTACNNLLALEYCGIVGCPLYAGSWSEYSSRLIATTTQ